jgi:hypothetical protein
MQIAEMGQKSPYDVDRVCWIHLFYDWETRRKRVFENDELTPETMPKDLGANEHHYKIQAVLPRPSSERTETELSIDLRPEWHWEMPETRKFTGNLAYDMARFFFFRAEEALPPCPKDAPPAVLRGARVSFGKPQPPLPPDVTAATFQVECYAGRFRVTVEKLEPGPRTE